VHSNPVFRNLNSSALALLVHVLKKTSANRAESIVRVGELGIGMHIIMEGSAKMTEGSLWMPPHKNSTDHASKTLESGDLTVGDSFGEEIIFDMEQSYRYTVIATANVSMYEIHQDDFNTRFQNLPELRNMMRARFLSSRGLSLRRRSMN